MHFRIASSILAAAVVLQLAGGGALAAARCGGTERWAVKTGADPDARNVNPGNPIDMTIAQLNALPQRRDRVPHGDNELRLPEELAVYRVNGRLVMFKDEADDDFHLVVADESRRFTAGGKKSDGKETGTSFIAEIVDPKCYAGKKGDIRKRSAFEEQLHAVRERFEERFPDGEGADRRMDVPVTLVGVAFYDRQHHQTGRARNGIELHPVLDIVFRDQEGVAAAAARLPSENLIDNPGFEDGERGWTGSAGVIVAEGYPDPRRGVGKALLGGHGERDTDSLWQQVRIPAGRGAATLRFALRVKSDEDTRTERRDTLAVQVRDNRGRHVETLGIFSNLDAGKRYQTRTFDMTKFKGQAIRLQFVSKENDSDMTAFILDDVELRLE